MTKSTVYLLVGTAITFGLLFLFVSVRLAGIGAAVFMAGYSLTNNHNLYFYLKVIATFAAFYLCVRAGFGGLGYLELFALYFVLRQHNYYKASLDYSLNSLAKKERML